MVAPKLSESAGGTHYRLNTVCVLFMLRECKGGMAYSPHTQSKVYPVTGHGGPEGE